MFLIPREAVLTTRQFGIKALFYRCMNVPGSLDQSQESVRDAPIGKCRILYL